MIALTHIVIGATGVSLILQTGDYQLLAIGGAASLFPDIDMSKSTAGKLIPSASRWFERRFPHRSCTHSLFASLILALVTYPIALLLLGYLSLDITHAINLGYFFGYFGDVFTANGCEMFWPSRVRAVWPGNRDFRLRTGSKIEYRLLVILFINLLWISKVNANGGIMTEFNKLVGSSIGVQQLYNEQGATHLIVAHIQGVIAEDGKIVDGDYLLIKAEGKSFIVQSKEGEIYKASATDPNAQILITRIVADVGQIATTRIDKLKLEDVDLSNTLSSYDNPKMMVYVSGEVKVDDSESLDLPRFKNEFAYLYATGATVTLEYAPLKNVISQIGNRFATGYLEIKIINNV